MFRVAGTVQVYRNQQQLNSLRPKGHSFESMETGQILLNAICLTIVMMIGLIVLPEKFTPPGVPVPSTMVDIASLSVRTAVAQAAVLIMWGKVVEWWNGHHPAGGVSLLT